LLKGTLSLCRYTAGTRLGHGWGGRQADVKTEIQARYQRTGLLRLTLALTGLYGLIAYPAGTRTQEIGIRMAAGEDRVEMLKMVVRHGRAWPRATSRRGE
jgi:hypothetical protein